MKKDIFEDIEVPSFEAKHVIKKGIQRGVEEQGKKNNRTTSKIIKIFLHIAAAIVLTFSLGFVSEPIAQAVSNIPIIGETLGGFYDAYSTEHDGSVEQLPAPEQIGETSLVATDQGITVEIVGAYNYHNGTIGIFFEASGDIKDRDVYGTGPNESGPESGYNFYLFDHTTDQQMIDYTSQEHVLEKVDETYVGNIEIHFEEGFEEDLDTIPLTFDFMCGKQGEWSFNIPVVDEPNTIALDVEQSEHGITIQYDSIYLGETTSSLYYSVTADRTYNGNEDVDFLDEEAAIQFTFEDDKGKEIPISSNDVPGYSMDDYVCIYSGEITFSKPIPSDCEWITVNVEVVNESGEKTALAPVKLDIKQ